MPAQCVADGLRAAARDRPSDCVGGHAEHQAEGGAQGLVEGENGMSGQPGKQRLGSRILKPMLREGDGGREANQSETREQKRVPGEQMHRT